MSEYTKGPWLLIEKEHTRGPCETHPHLEYFHIQGPQGDLDPNLCIAGFIKRADAKLITAAPELLAAAERSLNWLSSYQGGAALGMYDQMRAAIDKATK